MIEDEYKQLLIEEYSGVVADSDSLDRAKTSGAVSRNARRGTKQSKTVNQSSRAPGPAVNMQERLERL
jgi:hypothetical protein